MAAIKIAPSRMRLVDAQGMATPEFFRILQALQERTGGISGVLDASQIASSPTGDVAATDVQAAIAELASEKATVAALDAHIADATDAHDASAISNAPAGGIAATTVQAALNELDGDKEVAGAAAASMVAHLAAPDPHPQYLTAAEVASGFQPLDADLTSWAGVTRAAGYDTFAATPSSASLRALLTDETGTGAAVFADSPVLVTPALGTPASGNLANCTFPTLNQNTTGSAAKWTTPRALAGNNVDGSANVAFANKFIAQGTADAGLSAAQFLGALATGIVKNTTATGVLSIAVAADFPTLNQSTTGSAATLTTPRNIYGNAFNGSADLTAIIASTFGGTGNGFTKFAGPAAAEKTFTLPNASATILTDAAAVTVAQGGTGDAGTAWTTYTPTITVGAGAITTLGTVSGRYKTIGKTLFIAVSVAITTNGTAATSLSFSLPAGMTVNSGADCYLTGREVLATGNMLQGRAAASTTSVQVLTYNNLYAGGDGRRLALSGVIEIA
jgi:hypothetical protein